MGTGSERATKRVSKGDKFQLLDLILDKNYGENVDDPQTQVHIDWAPHLCLHYANELKRQLSERLLRSDIYTVAILETYLLVIRRLRNIDSTGILLHAASDHVKSYLSHRDDLVKIVLSSLLHTDDPQDAPPSAMCLQISRLMDQYSRDLDSYQDYFEGCDLDELDWNPEPIGATRGFRDVMQRDDIAHILTLASPKAYLDEFRTILGERLLEKRNIRFLRENEVIALFQARWGTSGVEDSDLFSLKATEIMVNDAKSSVAYNETFHSSTSAHVRSNRLPGFLQDDVANAPHDSQDPHTDFHALILSKHYWPEMRVETFELPPEIARAAQKYNQEFKYLKPRQKLEWLPSLGRVVVQLDLGGPQPTTIECTPSQAVVIQQFQHEDWEDSPLLTVSDLEELLRMDQSLVTSALTFWVGNLILKSTAEGHYSLLGTDQNAMDGAAAAAAAAVAAPAAESTALKTSADLLAENAPTYRNFITNMLANQGGMPAERILMLLKMLVAGGFGFEVDELRGLLDEMVEDGKLKLVGSVYKMA